MDEPEMTKPQLLVDAVVVVEPAWLSVTMLPPMLMLPVRLKVLSLGGAVNDNVPLKRVPVKLPPILLPSRNHDGLLTSVEQKYGPAPAGTV